MGDMVIKAIHYRMLVQQTNAIYFSFDGILVQTTKYELS